MMMIHWGALPRRATKGNPGNANSSRKFSEGGAKIKKLGEDKICHYDVHCTLHLNPTHPTRTFPPHSPIFKNQLNWRFGHVHERAVYPLLEKTCPTVCKKKHKIKGLFVRHLSRPLPSQKNRPLDRGLFGQVLNPAVCTDTQHTLSAEAHSQNTVGRRGYRSRLGAGKKGKLCKFCGHGGHRFVGGGTQDLWGGRTPL